ncbi:unnamed protein product [Amoebophrya sp. A25]|nr:unnamed protein product [Amoebophrya sp. A25]|eukprot:GSA25T00005032001.1
MPQLVCCLVHSSMCSNAGISLARCFFRFAVCLLPLSQFLGLQSGIFVDSRLRLRARGPDDADDSTSFLHSHRQAPFVSGSLGAGTLRLSEAATSSAEGGPSQLYLAASQPTQSIVSPTGRAPDASVGSLQSSNIRVRALRQNPRASSPVRPATRAVMPVHAASGEGPGISTRAGNWHIASTRNAGHEVYSSAEALAAGAGDGTLVYVPDERRVEVGQSSSSSGDEAPTRSCSVRASICGTRLTGAKAGMCALSAVALWIATLSGAFMVGTQFDLSQRGETEVEKRGREDRARVKDIGWVLPAMGPRPEKEIGGAKKPSEFLGVPSRYQLALDCSGSREKFLECFHEFTGDDPTHGFVDFAEGWNRRESLIKTIPPRPGRQANRIQIEFATGPPTPKGRPAIRLATKQEFGFGSLFVVDVERMPVGDGTWPAYWTTIKGGVDGCGWPSGGEIDMMEHIQGFGMENMVSTLHTDPGCWMHVPGITNGGNCQGNNGCGLTAKEVPSGHQFNKENGGIHLMSMDTNSIRMWFFNRATADHFDEEDMGLGAFWEKKMQELQPYATFPLESKCQGGTFFKPQTFIIDTTFCGDWAGQAFAPPGGPYGLPGCIHVVKESNYGANWDTQEHPESSRKFIFGSVRVFNPEGKGADWQV